MFRAQEVCPGTCLLGLYWDGGVWRWVDGISLGRNGHDEIQYNNWGGGQPQKNSVNQHNEHAAAFGEWGDGWHDVGDLQHPYGTTLCHISSCREEDAPDRAVFLAKMMNPA